MKYPCRIDKPKHLVATEEGTQKIEGHAKWHSGDTGSKTQSMDKHWVFLFTNTLQGRGQSEIL